MQSAVSYEWRWVKGRIALIGASMFLKSLPQLTLPNGRFMFSNDRRFTTLSARSSKTIQAARKGVFPEVHAMAFISEASYIVCFHQRPLLVSAWTSLVELCSSRRLPLVDS